MKWVMGPVSMELKWPGLEDDHSPPFGADVKNAWSYTPTPPYVFMAWNLETILMLNI
jgi:hypothetical protein